MSEALNETDDLNATLNDSGPFALRAGLARDRAADYSPYAEQRRLAEQDAAASYAREREQERADAAEARASSLRLAALEGALRARPNGGQATAIIRDAEEILTFLTGASK